MTRLTAVVLALTICAPHATAHGPVPAAVGLADYDGHGPRLVKMPVGAAARTDAGWQYVCKSRWGGPDTPLMQSIGDATVVIAANKGLVRLKSDLTTTLTDADKLSALTVRSLKSVGDDTFALTGFSNSSSVWRLDPDGDATKLHAAAQVIRAMATYKDGLLLAFVEDSALTLTQLGTDGVLGASRTITTPVEGTVALRPTSDGLYVRTQASLEYVLFKVEDDDTLTELARSEDPMHGPVVAHGRTFLTVDRNLSVLFEGAISTLDVTNRITCLGTADDTLYACVLPDLLKVDEAGAFGAKPLFALADLEKPSYDGLEEEDALSCEVDWLDFLTDAGLVLTPKPDGEDDAADEPTVVEQPAVEPPEDPGSCDCRSGRGPAKTPWAAAILLLLVGILVRRPTRARR